MAMSLSLTGWLGRIGMSLRNFFRRFRRRRADRDEADARFHPRVKIEIESRGDKEVVVNNNWPFSDGLPEYAPINEISVTSKTSHEENIFPLLNTPESTTEAKSNTENSVQTAESAEKFLEIIMSSGADKPSAANGAAVKENRVTADAAAENTVLPPKTKRETASRAAAAKSVKHNSAPPAVRLSEAAPSTPELPQTVKEDRATPTSSSENTALPPKTKRETTGRHAADKSAKHNPPPAAPLGEAAPSTPELPQTIKEDRIVPTSPTENTVVPPKTKRGMASRTANDKAVKQNSATPLGETALSAPDSQETITDNATKPITSSAKPKRKTVAASSTRKSAQPKLATALSSSAPEPRPVKAARPSENVLPVSPHPTANAAAPMTAPAMPPAPVLPQLEFTPIPEVLRQLTSHAHANLVLFSDRNGVPLAYSKSQAAPLPPRAEVEMMAKLAAGQIAASREICRTIGEEDRVDCLFHESARRNVFIYQLNTDFILTVVVDNAVTIGLVRIHANAAVQRLRETLEKL